MESVDARHGHIAGITVKVAVGTVFIGPGEIFVGETPLPDRGQVVMVSVNGRAGGQGTEGLRQDGPHLRARFEDIAHGRGAADLFVDRVPAPVIAVGPPLRRCGPCAQFPIPAVVEGHIRLAREIRGRLVQFRAVAIAITRAVAALGARGQPPPGIIGPRFRRTPVQGHR